MELNTLTQVIWIKVTVQDGMFSNEKAVSVTLLDGSQITLFASDRILKNEANAWQLRVTEIERNGQYVKVLLPSEAFETSSRWATIAI